MHKRVLKVVPSYFINESRDLREIRALGNNGYEVMVVAMHKAGLKTEETLKEFKLIRLHSYFGNKRGNPLFKILKYLEFYYRCARMGIQYNPNIISAQDFPGLLIGNKIKRALKDIPRLVYDSHELGSQMASNNRYPALVIRVKAFIERMLIKRSDVVMVVSNSISKYMKDDYSLQTLPTVIRNIPELKELDMKKNYFREVFNIENDKKIVLYQGIFAAGRGIEKLIRSMQYVDSSIVLVLLGQGPLEEYQKIIEQTNLSNRVYIHDLVPYDQLLDFTSSADLGVSIIENICLSYYYSLPNKIFEYLQAEIPIICSNFPDMSEVVERYGIGQTVNPESVEDIGRAINSILLNSNVYNKYMENVKEAKKWLNWDTEKKQLLEMYSDLQ